MDLLHRVRRTIDRHRLADSSTRVLVALSGGSDSVALAHLLHTLDGTGELRLIALAHFNHQLRPGAANDARFCRSVAEALGRPLLTGSEDVAARSRLEHRSIEETARIARH